jgi:hypothetical protein
MAGCGESGDAVALNVHNGASADKIPNYSYYHVSKRTISVDWVAGIVVAWVLGSSLMLSTFPLGRELSWLKTGLSQGW